MDKATYDSQCSASGLTTAYANVGASVADASITLNLPIYQLFKSIGLATCALNSAILLRFRFASTTMTHLTGSAMTLNTLQLVVRGKRLKQAEKMALRELYDENSRIPMSSSHLFADRMTVTQS